MGPMNRALEFVLIICILTGMILVMPFNSLLSAQNQPAVKRTPNGKASIPIRKDQLVSIDFNNVDIGIFIKFISDLTKKNFIIDDRVKGKVTIISPGKITVAEAYRVFESVLEVHGYAAVPAGKITKIVSLPDARSKNIKTRLTEEAGSPGDSVVTQIIPLRYADPNEIKKLFTPLVSKSSVILAYTPTNTLIITDVHSNVKRLLRILKAIDITGVGQQIAIIPVEYADAAKLVTLLKSVFASQKKARGTVSKDLTFVADERTNVIVLLASEGDTERIRQLVKILDKETPKGQAKIHVYYLEHASAEELASVLKDIPQKTSAQKAGGKQTAPVISDDVRISADKATNSLIIMADSEDYVTLEQIIRKIDIPRSMVYIEALIMEVDVSKDFRLGTEWLAGAETTYEDKDGIYGGGFSAGGFGGDPGTIGTTTGGLLAPGFSLGLFGESITISGITFPTVSAIFQAYKKDKDVRILSTPQILTTENQEAKIYVGKNIPFQTKSTTTDNDTFNSFEYRDVGRTLKITPHISIDRMVRLDISLESTDLESSTDFRPTTLKRTVDTTAIVKDRNTVVLGGLIDNTSSETVYKVPCLGDIPLLKILFSTKGRLNQSTNLYVFLTPRVIKNVGEAKTIYQKKRMEIEGLSEESIKLYNEPSAEDPSDQESKVESFEYRQQVETAPAAQAAQEASPSPESAMSVEASPTSPQNDAVAPPSSQTPVEPDTIAQDAQPTSGVMNDDNAFTPPATSTDPPTTNDAAEGYTVQVASVQAPDMAEELLQQLTDKGYAAYTVQTEVGNQTWYRLRVGYFATADDAENLLAKLRDDKYNPLLIKF